MMNLENKVGFKEVGGSLLLLLVFLGSWQWGPEALGVPKYIIPPASDVFNEFFFMIERERLFYHSLMTGFSVAAGFVFGSLLGIIVGYMLGVSRGAEVILSPYILALQIAPKVAFAPLFVLWFGYTVYPKILVAVLIVFFPVMINVLSAIRNVDPDLINLARAFSGSRWQIFRIIEFHAAMPPLFSGLRIGATLAVIGVVVGELVGGNTGLGYLLIFGEGSGNTSMVFVAIIMLTIIGIIAYLLVILLERRVLHYLPRAATQAV
jgi:NitT/TauT family transport system permease protein